MRNRESKVPPARRRGLRLDAFREALGIGKREFAKDYLGVADSNYSNWVYGRHNLPFEVLEAAHAHGLDANWVIHGIDRGLPADLRDRVVEIYRQNIKEVAAERCR